MDTPLYTARRSWVLTAALLTAATALAAAGYGGLVDRGGGAGAARHTLPAHAIDTPVLPHTRLGADDSPDDTLPFYRLAPDTYFFYGNIATIDADNRGFNGNAGFVVTDEGVIVIDALGTPRLGQRLIATVRSVTDQPIRYLILTHNHPDHAYGASALRALDGVQVVGHPGMAEYLVSPTFEQSVEYRRGLLPQDMAGFTAVAPDLLVPAETFGRLRLELGGRTFDVYNSGHHHSHGDLVVHQVEDGILWVSDLAFNQRVTYIGDGHSAALLAAHDWLQKTFGDIRLMVPGHGSAQRPPFPMLAATRAYVEGLRARMRQQLEADRSLQDAVAAAAMPDWAQVPLYEENHRANASFIYRELEPEFF